MPGKNGKHDRGKYHIDEFARKEGKGSRAPWRVFNPDRLKEIAAEAEFGLRRMHRLVSGVPIGSLLKIASGHVELKTNETCDRHYRSKGIKTVNPAGYLYSTVRKANGLRDLEHRVVMQRELGRPLAPGEVVHHVNFNKLDNRPQNLVVLSQSEHVKAHQNFAALSGRMMEHGLIAYSPETQEYAYVGPKWYDND